MVFDVNVKIGLIQFGCIKQGTTPERDISLYISIGNNISRGLNTNKFSSIWAGWPVYAALSLHCIVELPDFKRVLKCYVSVPLNM